MLETTRLTHSGSQADNFAVMNKTPGWLYVVIVQSGYVVPLITAQSSPDWGTREAEIAQYGPIPADRIVGFTFIQTDPIEPYGPIFMRKSFREKEPKAFEFMFDMMSGGCPGEPTPPN